MILFLPFWPLFLIENEKQCFTWNNFSFLLFSLWINYTIKILKSQQFKAFKHTRFCFYVSRETLCVLIMVLLFVFFVLYFLIYEVHNRRLDFLSLKIEMHLILCFFELFGSKLLLIVAFFLKKWYIICFFDWISLFNESICCGFLKRFLILMRFCCLKSLEKLSPCFFGKKIQCFQWIWRFSKKWLHFLRFCAIFYNFLLYFRVFFDFFLNFGFVFLKMFFAFVCFLAFLKCFLKIALLVFWRWISCLVSGKMLYAQNGKKWKLAVLFVAPSAHRLLTNSAFCAKM